MAKEVKSEPPKKALKKNEIIAEYRALKEKFEVLEEEHRVLIENTQTNIEAISLLEETISILESKLNASKVEKEHINTSVQTEIIRCEECEYPADDMHELVDHMHGAHPLDNDDCIKCDSCWKEFRVQSDLVVHIQNEHSDKVKLCSHFLEGRCIFADSCWFLHDESQQVQLDFKCIYCDSTFNSKSDLMSHRKREHPGKIKECKNEMNGSCQHGPKFCW